MSYIKPVCAVVVTFNRKELLIKCLDAIMNQTKKPNKIIIINNCSTDQTLTCLLNNHYINDYSKVSQENTWETTKVVNNVEITCLNLSENTGGAGGFYEGQKRAYELGYEWIWMMDDDGRPKKNCLENLWNKAESSNISFLNPLVVDINDNNKLAFGLGKDIKSVKEAIETSGKAGLIKWNVNPFNGTFFNKTIIDKIGFIKKEMFIWGDEAEYLYRLDEQNIIYATDCSSIHYHPQNKSVIKPVFFGLINIIVKPANLEMNYYRNLGFINKRFRKKINAKFIMLYFFYFLVYNGFRKGKIFLKYYFDGVNNTYRLKNIINER